MASQQSPYQSIVIEDPANNIFDRCESNNHRASSPVGTLPAPNFHLSPIKPSMGRKPSPKRRKLLINENESIAFEDISVLDQGDSTIFIDSYLQSNDSSLEFADITDLSLHTSSVESTVTLPSTTLSHLLGSKCCVNRCLASVSLMELEQCRQRFKQKSRLQQRQFIIDILLISKRKKVSTHLINGYVMLGKEICEVAFITVLGISEKRLRNVKCLCEAGVTSAVRAPQQYIKSDKRISATTWMNHYFNRIGDKMPHIEQIHLPHFLSKKAVYGSMCEELALQGFTSNDIVSRSTFYSLWNTEFSRCIIPKQSLFSKCDVCVKFTQERLKLAGKKQEIFLLQAEYKQHLELVENERKKYYHHREKSRSNPQKYATIIIDGMDQSKTNLPHFVQCTKSMQNLWKLRTHLTGALLHTQAPKGKLAFGFYDILQWSHDSNLTINVLLNVLHKLATISQMLPQVLYMQFDNCFRENKNRYILAFCALMVQLKIFTKVRLNFLPVGHTHEDIDQFFSKVATHLNRVGAETVKGLLRITGQSYTPTPHVSLLEQVYDVRSWLAPFIKDIHGHSQPHCFRFQLNSEGIAVMSYKNWSHEGWSEEPLFLLKDVPTGSPVGLQPDFSMADISHFKNDFSKWQKWMEPSSHAEWSKFLESLTGSPSVNKPWLLDSLTRLRLTTAEVEQIPQVAPNFPSLLARQNQECNVYTGSRSGEKTSVTEVDDTSKIEVGQYVAVHCENYTNEPVIGQCTQISGDMIQVTWMKGSYSAS